MSKDEEVKTKKEGGVSGNAGKFPEDPKDLSL